MNIIMNLPILSFWGRVRLYPSFTLGSGPRPPLPFRVGSGLPLLPFWIGSGPLPFLLAGPLTFSILSFWVGAWPTPTRRANLHSEKGQPSPGQPLPKRRKGQPDPKDQPQPREREGPTQQEGPTPTPRKRREGKPPPSLPPNPQTSLMFRGGSNCFPNPTLLSFIFCLFVSFTKMFSFLKKGFF